MPVLVRRMGIPRSPVTTPALRRRAERMLQAVDLPQVELSLLLCSDEVIRELNCVHRARDRPTDVLAFPMLEGDALRLVGAGQPLGDVAVSLPTASRQAERAGHPPLDEVTFLLAHGLLHLLGYDHQTRAEERRMMARTDLLRAAASARSGLSS